MRRCNQCWQDRPESAFSAPTAKNCNKCNCVTHTISRPAIRRRASMFKAYNSVCRELLREAKKESSGR